MCQKLVGWIILIQITFPTFLLLLPSIRGFSSIWIPRPKDLNLNGQIESNRYAFIHTIKLLMSITCRFRHLPHSIWRNEQSLSVAIWWMNQSVLWRVSINVKASRSWNQQTDVDPSNTQEKKPEWKWRLNFLENNPRQNLGISNKFQSFGKSNPTLSFYCTPIIHCAWIKRRYRRYVCTRDAWERLTWLDFVIGQFLLSYLIFCQLLTNRWPV